MCSELDQTVDRNLQTLPALFHETFYLRVKLQAAVNSVRETMQLTKQQNGKYQYKQARHHSAWTLGSPAKTVFPSLLIFLTHTFFSFKLSTFPHLHYYLRLLFSIPLRKKKREILPLLTLPLVSSYFRNHHSISTFLEISHFI